MKNSLLPIILIAFLGCSQKTGEVDAVLDDFKELNSNPLTIESISHINDDSTYMFTGSRLDSTIVKNTSGVMIFQSITDETYACYRFQLKENIYGLILRTPSTQWSSSIKICLYNQTINEITECLEVAEIFGDDGYEFTKTALLTKAENSYTLEIKKNECEADENFENIVCTDSVFNYSVDESSIRLLSKKVLQN